MQVLISATYVIVVHYSFYIILVYSILASVTYYCSLFITRFLYYTSLLFFTYHKVLLLSLDSFVLVPICFTYIPTACNLVPHLDLFVVGTR